MARTDHDAATLKHIAALLFVLADLADLAAYRSPAVRAFVLWVLYRAGAVTERLLDCERFIESPPAPFNLHGGSPSQAMWVAANLRVLALRIELSEDLDLVARRIDGRLARSLGSTRSAPPPGVLAPLATLALSDLGLSPTLQAPDTS